MQFTSKIALFLLWYAIFWMKILAVSKWSEEDDDTHEELAIKLPPIHPAKYCFKLINASIHYLSK
jgi:hypothetical protein